MTRLVKITYRVFALVLVALNVRSVKNITHALKARNNSNQAKTMMPQRLSSVVSSGISSTSPSLTISLAVALLIGFTLLSGGGFIFTDTPQGRVSQSVDQKADLGQTSSNVDIKEESNSINTNASLENKTLPTSTKTDITGESAKKSDDTILEKLLNGQFIALNSTQSQQLLTDGTKATEGIKPATNSNLSPPVPASLLLPTPLSLPQEFSPSASATEITNNDLPSKANVSQPIWDTHEVEVKPGETLSSVLTALGADVKTVYQLTRAITPVLPPSRLMPGHLVRATFKKNDASPNTSTNGVNNLEKLSVELDALRSVFVIRDEKTKNFLPAELKSKPTTTKTIYKRGQIKQSFAQTANKLGIPSKVVIEFVKLFSYEVDFARDISANDEFAVLYDAQTRLDGVETGQYTLLMLELKHEQKTKRYYRYARSNDGARRDFFNTKGESIRKALLRTPIPGAEVSSPYGMRKHPILGYSRMHRGVDFAARSGTDIYAAGDGVITRMSYDRKGYGRYIIIDHGRGYHTLYGHMSKFARNVKLGKRVRQRQVIGYVGSTGLSTGPHLHFEVRRNGDSVNPSKITIPTVLPLVGKDRVAFSQHVQKMHALALDITQKSPTELGFLDARAIPVMRPSVDLDTIHSQRNVLFDNFTPDNKEETKEIAEKDVAKISLAS